MRVHTTLAVLATLAASLPGAAAWEELRRGDAAVLSIDPASIKRGADTVSFMYLIDFPKTQTDFKQGIAYRSMVVKAQIRCSTKRLALGNTDVFAEPGGKGANLGSMFPDKIEASFQRVEPGTSDEDLLKRVCPAKK